MSARLSGWCSSIGRHEGFHSICQQRLDDGLLDRCECPGHNTSVGETSTGMGQLGKKVAPQRANVRGLTDQLSRSDRHD